MMGPTPTLGSQRRLEEAHYVQADAETLGPEWDDAILLMQRRTEAENCWNRAVRSAGDLLRSFHHSADDEEGSGRRGAISEMSPVAE